jgi:hypothetical protein
VDRYFVHDAQNKARQQSALSPADLICSLPDRIGGWPCELKRRHGRLSEPQQAMRDHLERCGFEYLMTDDFDQASGGEP